MSNNDKLKHIQQTSKHISKQSPNRCKYRQIQQSDFKAILNTSNSCIRGQNLYKSNEIQHLGFKTISNTINICLWRPKHLSYKQQSCFNFSFRQTSLSAQPSLSQLTPILTPCPIRLQQSPSQPHASQGAKPLPRKIMPLSPTRLSFSTLRLGIWRTRWKA